MVVGGVFMMNGYGNGERKWRSTAWIEVRRLEVGGGMSSGGRGAPMRFG